MANGFAAKLRVNLRPSRYLVKFIGITYLMAVFICLITPADWLIRVIAALILISYASYQILILTGGNRVRFIEYNRMKGWQLNKSGAVYPATLIFPFYITHWLVVFSFSLSNGRKEKIVLLPDSTNSTEFRHLRVRLLQLANASSKHV